jgi:SRR1 domain
MRASTLTTTDALLSRLAEVLPCSSGSNRQTDDVTQCHVVCYGIGRFGSNNNACAQLALLCEIIQRCSVDSKYVSFLSMCLCCL